MANSTKIRAPFPWLGGKGSPKIKNFILKNLPPHTAYVEPFGGGASILLAKKPVDVEVYNDVNRGIVNFFRVLADGETFVRFFARVEKLPTSRELYEEYLRTWTAIHDPVEQAVRWYYVARNGFGGVFGNSFVPGVTTNCTHRWESALEDIHAVHTRMKAVVIECLDWREILKTYNAPGYLAYCDPPYAPGTRRSGGYAHELQDKDHEELVETLMSYPGAILLSGYDTPLYAPLEAAGWDKVEVDVVCSAAGHTRTNGLCGAGSSLEKQRRTECLWRNPETQRRLFKANKK